MKIMALRVDTIIIHLCSSIATPLLLLFCQPPLRPRSSPSLSVLNLILLTVAFISRVVNLTQKISELPIKSTLNHYRIKWGIIKNTINLRDSILLSVSISLKEPVENNPLIQRIRVTITHTLKYLPHLN